MDPGATLMLSTAVVVVRRPSLLWQHPAWDIASPTGLLLATVVRVEDRTVRYVVAQESGEPIWSVGHERTGRLSRFVVSDHHGSALGEVDQENSLFSPQLRLIAPDGATVRLDGAGRRAGPWAVQDLSGQPLGSVALTPPKPDALPVRIYLVQRGEGLGGELWPLVIVSAFCLDLVQERK